MYAECERGFCRKVETNKNTRLDSWRKRRPKRGTRPN
ncbi:hypothetical protein KP509_23G043700 [Ceratopteris richardii]|uniref:Uncharacterized protein n=1 Tax=Ceratopteris richardii TaxID=49495 RepID=A0A8T2S262_CERRI|nr:hypothetical protein KP509_23G043700 [Ceratopteris richardii]